MSFFIAKVMGTSLLVLAIALMSNADVVKKMYNDLIKSSTAMFFVSFMRLFFGLLIVAVHFTWIGFWPTVITVFALLMIIEGITGLVFPHLLMSVGKHMLKKHHVLEGAYLLMAVLGAGMAAYGRFGLTL